MKRKRRPEAAFSWQACEQQGYQPSHKEITSHKELS